ncbi:class I SAM-dependent methyltransferase [Roseovarius spongiae]|uniref:Class I SAM-dependent methyltransferase n=1 Tax=Roseovarius spongiae TaxID=2320272 RepID=A0A3A8BB79_9RHOB|nr:class I SAM-dependent methyltransferase [Roseovarius spongiae]RKF16594.1 class I SAM-dependent methyltransferase [Roseovarius spongiae]
MSQVREQYEAYPYPERDPADEAKRLVTGSPSHPLEIDHFVFGGQRDWAQPFRALVAGGGTGDGLIQLAQILAQAGRPAEITYLDLSTAARKVAEARAQARKLTNIRFLTGSLLDAPDLGAFDYIDCCGVLHHLPDPAEGFAALRAALAPGGGMGFMVYAPHGRAGVYPLQQAFATLLGDMPPAARLKAARGIMRSVPDAHPFKRNAIVGDHKDSDAGFYDLLLHSQDRAFSVSELLGVMEATGWRLSGFAMPALYELERLTDIRIPDHLDAATRMALAEKLRGTIKTHVGYAVASDAPVVLASGRKLGLIPHIRGIAPQKLAQGIAQGQRIKLPFAGVESHLELGKEIAPLIGAINGRRSLAEIARAARIDPVGMGALWARADRELTSWGMLHYSTLLR